jgi:hypothetical protein
MMLPPHPLTPPQGNLTPPQGLLTPPPGLSHAIHVLREGGVKRLQGGVRVGSGGGVTIPQKNRTFADSLRRVGGGGGFHEKVFDMRQKGLREMDKSIERKVFPQAPHHPPPRRRSQRCGGGRTVRIGEDSGDLGGLWL